MLEMKNLYGAISCFDESEIKHILAFTNILAAQNTFLGPLFIKRWDAL